MALCEQKPQRCHAHETEGAGEMGDHTAVAADSTRVVRLVGGKRTPEQTQALVQDARRRLRAGPVPAIFPEASAGDASAIVEACGRRYSAPRLGMKGRAPHAMLRWPQGWASGQGHKQDTGNRVERIEGRARYGTARLQHVLALLGSQQSNTRVLERQNGTSR